MHKELREMHAAREAEREKEKRAAAAARKAESFFLGGSFEIEHMQGMCIIDLEIYHVQQHCLSYTFSEST